LTLVFDNVRFVTIFARDYLLARALNERGVCLRGNAYRLLAVAPKLCEIRPRLLITTSRKSHMPFPLVTKSMILCTIAVKLLLLFLNKVAKKNPWG